MDTHKETEKRKKTTPRLTGVLQEKGSQTIHKYVSALNTGSRNYQKCEGHLEFEGHSVHPFTDGNILYIVVHCIVCSVLLSDLLKL